MYRRLILVVAISLLAGCADEPGSEGWCASLKEQPKSEWSADDAVTFAKHCVLESQTIGSESWCENVKEKPKSEWTASEAADYARHCVM